MDAYSYENDPTAVVGRRFAAFLIDLLSAVVVGAVVLALTGLTRVVTDDAGFAIEGPDGNIDQFDPSQLILEVGNDVYVVDSMRNFWFGAGLFLLFLWIFVQGLTGRSLGKWVTGVRAIATDGSNPGAGRSLIRTLLWAVDIFLIGPMMALTTAGHRRLGDVLGRTFVVDQEFAGTGITIEDGSARTRSVGDDAEEIDLRDERDEKPAASSRKDKKQAERDAEERIRAKQEAEAKARAAKADAPKKAEPVPVEKTPEPVIEQPQPISAEATPERVPATSVAAYGAGAAAAAASTTPAWPTIGETAPTADASPLGAPVSTPTPVSTPPISTPPISTPPVSTPPVSTPPIATPSVATPTVATPSVPSSSSSAFPPTAFGGGADSGATDASDPIERQHITPESTEARPDDTVTTVPAVSEDTTQQAGTEWEYEPQWDDDRQTYILWDARRSEWLQWNEAGSNWGPISQ